MIAVEGYKAFTGEMLITPKNPEIKPFTVKGEWLYKPDTNCWYGKGSSYPDEICRPLSDEAIAAKVRNLALTTQLNAFKCIYRLEPEELAKAKAESRVVIFPCKIGDPAWVLDTEECDGGEDAIFRGEVGCFHQTTDGVWWVTIEKMSRKCWFAGTDRRVSDLGKDWFRSLGDAQRAIAEEED